jgi:hypothetical protein
MYKNLTGLGKDLVLPIRANTAAFKFVGLLYRHHCTSLNVFDHQKGGHIQQMTALFFIYCYVYFSYSYMAFIFENNNSSTFLTLDIVRNVQSTAYDTTFSRTGTFE